MQTLKSAAVVFCTACICAELLARLTGNSWAQRCIKAVAGLYILVVFARTVPQAHVHPSAPNRSSVLFCAGSFAHIHGHAGRCHSG